MADETSLELLMKIRADASQAHEATQSLKSDIAGVAKAQEAANRTIQQSEVGAVNAQRTVAQALKDQGVSAKDVEGAYKQLGYSAQAAAKEISAAFGPVAASTERLGYTARQSGGMMNTAFLKSYATTQLLGKEIGTYIPFSVARLMSSLPGLQEAMAAAFSVTVITFAAESIYRVAGAIYEAQRNAEGYGKAVEKYFRQDFAKQLVSEPTLALQKQAYDQTVKLEQELERVHTLQDRMRKSGVVNPAAVIELNRLFEDLNANQVKWADFGNERLRLTKLAEQEYKALQAKQRESGALLIEVLRAQAEAAEAGGHKIAGLRMQLKSLALEEAAAIKESGRDEDKANAERQIYAARRIQIEREITAALEEAEEKRKAAALRAEHARELAAQRAAAIVARAAAQEQAFVERSNREVTSLMRRLDEINARAGRGIQRLDQELPKGPGRSGIPALPPEVLQGQKTLTDQALKGVSAITPWNQALLTLKESLNGVRGSLHGVLGPQQTLFAEMERTTGATIKAGIAAAMYGQSVGKAMEQATKATLAAIAEQAAVKAVFSLATYFIDMATYQYQAAAQALTAAELFAAVGAAAGAIGAAIPGGATRGGSGGSSSRRYSAASGAAGGSYGSSSGGGSGQQVVPGGNFPSAAKNGNLTIAIMGESEAGQWLANTLNNVVQQGGAQLGATHTTAIPSPMA